MTWGWKKIHHPGRKVPYNSSAISAIQLKKLLIIEIYNISKAIWMYILHGENNQGKKVLPRLWGSYQSRLMTWLKTSTPHWITLKVGPDCDPNAIDCLPQTQTRARVGVGVCVGVCVHSKSIKCTFPSIYFSWQSWQIMDRCPCSSWPYFTWNKRGILRDFITMKNLLALRLPGPAARLRWFAGLQNETESQPRKESVCVGVCVSSCTFIGATRLFKYNRRSPWGTTARNKEQEEELINK